jgi:hypothetical protein
MVSDALSVLAVTKSFCKIVTDTHKPLFISVYVAPQTVFNQVFDQLKQVAGLKHLDVNKFDSDMDDPDFVCVQSSDPSAPTFFTEARIRMIELFASKRMQNGNTSEGCILVLVDPKTLSCLPAHWIAPLLIVDEPELVAGAREDKGKRPKLYKGPQFVCHHIVFMTASPQQFKQLTVKSWVFEHVKAMKIKQIPTLEANTVTVDPEYVLTNTRLSPPTYTFDILQDTSPFESRVITLLSKMKQLRPDFLYSIIDALCMEDWSNVSKNLTDVFSLPYIDPSLVTKSTVLDMFIKVFNNSTDEENAKAAAKNTEIIRDSAISESMLLKMKINAVRRYVEDLKDNPKVVVFTRFQEVKLADELDSPRASFDVKTQDQLINILKTPQGRAEFVNNGKKTIIVLDPDVFGRGLNLEFVNYMIILQVPTIEILGQWEGRAHRFGRDTDKPLTVKIIVGKNENAEPRKALRDALVAKVGADKVIWQDNKGAKKNRESHV